MTLSLPLSSYIPLQDNCYRIWETDASVIFVPKLYTSVIPFHYAWAGWGDEAARKEEADCWIAEISLFCLFTRGLVHKR